MSHPEKDIEQINANLKEIGDQLKAHAERADKEIKAHQKLSGETRENVDKLLTQQGELQARLQTAEQLLAKVQNGGGEQVRPKTMGEQFTESEGFQAYAGNPKGSFKARVAAQVTSDPGSAGDLVVPQRVPGIVAPPNQQLRIRNLLSWGRTASNSVEYVRETGFTNNAETVSEGAEKPESDLTFEDDAAPVVTIAHWTRATRQILADFPMLQSYIDGRLRYGLKLKEDGKLLKGSGVGLEMDGIWTQASLYANPGVAVQAETRIDRLRLALLQVELAEYPADGIVLNPIDWAALELIKTAENAYLFANPRFVTQAGLWGRPVVTTKSMELGDFLVGSFQMGAQGWDREDVNVAVALEDGNNFTTNRVTIRVEERLALTVYRPEAFIKGDFDDLVVGS
ncbi:phage major capsid protein [Achromobacter pestifer]